MKEFYIVLPNTGYEDIRVNFRKRDSYDPQKTADEFAKLLQHLYGIMPQVVVERLRRDERIEGLRRALEEKS